MGLYGPVSLTCAFEVKVLVWAGCVRPLAAEIEKIEQTRLYDPELARDIEARDFLYNVTDELMNTYWVLPTPSTDTVKSPSHIRLNFVDSQAATCLNENGDFGGNLGLQFHRLILSGLGFHIGNSCHRSRSMFREAIAPHYKTVWSRVIHFVKEESEALTVIKQGTKTEKSECVTLPFSLEKAKSKLVLLVKEMLLCICTHLQSWKLNLLNGVPIFDVDKTKPNDVQKRHTSSGRISKTLGDVLLLRGEASEALQAFSSSIDECKNSMDYIWQAAALEGLSSAAFKLMCDSMQDLISEKTSSKSGTDVEKPKLPSVLEALLKEHLKRVSGGGLSISASFYSRDDSTHGYILRRQDRGGEKSVDLHTEKTYDILVDFIASKLKDATRLYHAQQSSVAFVESSLSFLRFLAYVGERVVCLELVTELVSDKRPNLNVRDTVECFAACAAVAKGIRAFRKYGFVLQALCDYLIKKKEYALGHYVACLTLPVYHLSKLRIPHESVFHPFSWERILTQENRNVRRDFKSFLSPDKKINLDNAKASGTSLISSVSSHEEIKSILRRRFQSTFFGKDDSNTNNIFGISNRLAAFSQSHFEKTLFDPKRIGSRRSDLTWCSLQSSVVNILRITSIQEKDYFRSVYYDLLTVASFCHSV
eukprot:GHVP01065390.1.p1 GENE.GHVP01065390.1~~GHVP01065390.1.p1  ORF type:complete len:649 (+),score=89.74 GHVP01065390.1:2518-4464(+)